MDKETMTDILWQLDIGPRLVGYRYLLHALELVRSGEEIAPELMQKIAESYGVTRSSVYSAVKSAQRHASGCRPVQYQELKKDYGSSVYGFIYALSRQI